MSLFCAHGTGYTTEGGGIQPAPSHHTVKLCLSGPDTWVRGLGNNAASRDCGVKARTNEPSPLEDFLALIDTMPMQRAELRSRGGDGAVCDSKD